MLKLYYKLYRRFYNIPHRNHIKRILNNPLLQTRQDSSLYKVCYEYSNGLTIPQISEANVITIERVRQLLLKAYRYDN